MAVIVPSNWVAANTAACAALAGFAAMDRGAVAQMERMAVRKQREVFIERKFFRPRCAMASTGDGGVEFSEVVQFESEN
jgi:hypothetical protein